MMEAMIAAFLLIALAAIGLTPFAEPKWKGLITVAAICLMAAVSSYPAVLSLYGSTFELVFRGSIITGSIPVRIDALSGWFMLLLNFTFITGAFYGLYYMEPYRSQAANLSVHCISFILVYSSLISICVLQNSIAFLTAWEVMAISSFLLIIFEHYKIETIRAGINFLIQSHACILLLTLGFIWVASKMHSFDFNAIHTFSLAFSMLSGVALFLCFFAGFAIKAGFVPFHTWLPYAHPAAPSHVSGVLSGVIIKIGIYGLLRMLLLIKTDYAFIGYIILFISMLTGVYGVMLAILQHNLKKLLAYHSIENIGIIGIGIGLGCIGKGTGNFALTVSGFSGALLHTLNHSLFKSVLFYGAGNVYQSTHTMNIEKLGGLIKKIPHTAFLFLVSALAICGLPPFNGFISEFIIFSGMMAGLPLSSFGYLISFVFSFFSLALIGGMALLCFTKAFGIVFLGSPGRYELLKEPERLGKVLPLYAGAALMLLIGIFPKLFLGFLRQPTALFTDTTAMSLDTGSLPVAASLSGIGMSALFFMVLAGLIYLLKVKSSRNKVQAYAATWGCGYEAPTPQMQYTASSFTRAFRKLFEPLLIIHKKKKPLAGIFPGAGMQETHPYDKLELWLIDIPLNRLKRFINRFAFLQNGNPQFYILYGMIFIALVLATPVISEHIESIIHFLSKLHD